MARIVFWGLFAFGLIRTAIDGWEQRSPMWAAVIFPILLIIIIVRASERRHKETAS